MVKLQADTSTQGTQWGTGGMATKLTAARIAVAGGTTMVRAEVWGSVGLGNANASAVGLRSRQQRDRMGRGRGTAVAAGTAIWCHTCVGRHLCRKV